MPSPKMGEEQIREPGEPKCEQETTAQLDPMAMPSSPPAACAVERQRWHSEEEQEWKERASGVMREERRELSDRVEAPIGLKATQAKVEGEEAHRLMVNLREDEVPR